MVLGRRAPRNLLPEFLYIPLASTPVAVLGLSGKGSAHLGLCMFGLLSNKAM